MFSCRRIVLNTPIASEEPPAPISLSAFALTAKTQLKTLIVNHISSEDGTRTSSSSRVNYTTLKSSPQYSAYLSQARALNTLQFDMEMPRSNENEKKSFFLNLYNALTLHAMIETENVSNTMLSRLSFFNSYSYGIGTRLFSLNDIEHGVLRRNSSSPAGFFPVFRGWMFSSLPLFASDDLRMLAVMKVADPRIHFALNCGANSCPAIRAYSPSDEIDAQLDLAAMAFLQEESNCGFDGETKVLKLSMILHWYAKDFGKDDEQVVDFIKKFCTEQVKTALDQAGAMIKIEYFPYDWTSNAV